MLIALGNVVVWIALSACVRHTRRPFRRHSGPGIMSSLRRGWNNSSRGGGAGSEERNKLIVEEEVGEGEEGVGWEGEVRENGIELHHMAESRT